MLTAILFLSAFALDMDYIAFSVMRVNPQQSNRASLFQPHFPLKIIFVFDLEEKLTLLKFKFNVACM